MLMKDAAVRGLALATLGAAVCGLCSCNEEGGENTAAAPAGTSAAQPAQEKAAGETPAVASVEEVEEELLDILIFDLGMRASELSSHPELNASVRNMLEKLENYYSVLSDELAGSERKLRLALRLADTIKNLGAWERANSAYQRALADYEAMPQGLRDKAECRRLLSSIYNGMGFCALRRGNSSEAIDYYAKSNEIDTACFMQAAPEESDVLPEGEQRERYLQAAADLLFSIRCLGECQTVVQDVEEAREMYKRGATRAEQVVTIPAANASTQRAPLWGLSQDVSLQYVRLLVALGNLESSCSNAQEAFNNWLKAAQICELLTQRASSLIIRNKAAQILQGIVPQLRAMQQDSAQQQAEGQPEGSGEAAEQPAAPQE